MMKWGLGRSSCPVRTLSMTSWATFWNVPDYINADRLKYFRFNARSWAISSKRTCRYADRREIKLFDHHVKTTNKQSKKPWMIGTYLENLFVKHLIQITRSFNWSGLLQYGLAIVWTSKYLMLEIRNDWSVETVSSLWAVSRLRHMLVIVCL